MKNNIVQYNQPNNVLAVPVDSAAFVTSRDIAELTGKRHDNVRRTIESLAEGGFIDVPQIEEHEIINSIGKRHRVSVFVFTGEQGKTDSYVVVAQLSPTHTKRLVQRWQELEQKIADHSSEIDGSDPRVMAAVFNHLYIENQRKDEVIKEQTQQISKLDAILDRIYRIKDSLLPTDAAKTLEVSPRWLSQYLADSKWFYKHKRAQHWTGFQDKIDRGYLVHKITDYRDSCGNLHTKSQVRITPKGMIKLAEQISKIKQYH